MKTLACARCGTAGECRVYVPDGRTVDEVIDASADGTVSQAEIAAMYGLTRSRVEQIVAAALLGVLRRSERFGLLDYVDGDRELEAARLKVAVASRGQSLDPPTRELRDLLTRDNQVHARAMKTDPEAEIERRRARHVQQVMQSATWSRLDREAARDDRDARRADAYARRKDKIDGER